MARKLLFISLASAAAWAAMANTTLAQTSKPAAIVNGEAITMAEVQAALRVRPPNSSAQLNDQQRRELEREAVELLIDEAIMRQFLRHHCPPVDPKDVAKRFDELQTGLKAQNRTLADYCRETGQSPDQLRLNIVDMLQWNTYVRGRLSDAEVLRYFNENRDFFDKVMVQASHIVLRLSPTASEPERQAARAKLEAIRQDILSGKIDFAEAAKKYSQCPTAPHGGDIGYFPRKFAVDDSFARVAFSLQKGEVSGIVQSEYGLHLIKCTDRKAGTPAAFDRIKDDVREIAADEMQQNLLKEQRKLAQVTIYLGAEQNKMR